MEEVVKNGAIKRKKLQVKSPTPTPSFLQAGCPSCRPTPTKSVKALERKDIALHGLAHPTLTRGLVSSSKRKLMFTSREGCQASRHPSDAKTPVCLLIIKWTWWLWRQRRWRWLEKPASSSGCSSLISVNDCSSTSSAAEVDSCSANGDAATGSVFPTSQKQK